LAAAALTLTMGSRPSAQTPGPIWLADDVAEVALGQPNCIRYPRVNGFGFAPDGTAMVGWTQVEGCGGNNETYWSEKLAAGWLKRQWGSQNFWSGPNGAAHEFAVGADGRPYLFMVGGDGNSLTYHTYRADLRAHAEGQPGYLVWTGEHVGNHQECIYVRYRVEPGPGQDWPYRVTVRGNCSNAGPIRFEGQQQVSYVNVAGFDLAMGADGRAHMAYVSGGQVFYLRPGVSPVLVTTVNRFSDDVAVQAGADGTIHLVVRGLGSTSDHDRALLAYFRSTDDGITWTHVDNADASRLTYKLSLQLDAAGTPAVAYWRYGYGLIYATRASGAWVESRVVNPGWSGDQWVQSPHLKFDAFGVPHIAYYDWAANRIRISSPAPAGIDPPVDLRVSGNASPNPTVTGTTVTYTLKVANASAREASGVRVQVTLPAGAKASNIDPPALSNSGGVLTFDRWRVLGGGTGHDRLPSQAVGTVTFDVTGLTLGISELPVVVSSAQAEATPDDNSTVVTARINEASCALPVSGRTAWWPGDGTPRNYGVVGQYHGTPVGGVTYGPGAVGQAFQFDGTGYVKVPNGYSEYYWPGTSATSVAAWFATGAPSAAIQVIAAMDDMANAPCCGSPQGHAAFYLYVQNGVVKVGLRQNVYGSASIGLVGTTPVADGEFHHAALVIDIPALQARLYVDGALEASAPLPGGWTMSNGDFEAEELVIGAAQVVWGFGYQYRFTGAIDDVALYKRALTAAEIANAVTGARRAECGAVPVTLNSPGDQTGREDDTVTLALDATVGDGRTPSFTAIGLPPGLSIAADTGVISGTLAAGSAGDYTVTVRVSDLLTEASVTFGWSVLPPVLPVLTLHAGAGASLTVVETGDQCFGGGATGFADRTCAIELPAGTYTVQGTTPLSTSHLNWHWTLNGTHVVSAAADRMTVDVVKEAAVSGSLLGAFQVQRLGVEVSSLGPVTAPLPPYQDGTPGFECGAGSTCTGLAPLNSWVTLKAAPGEGSVFRSWHLACKGTEATCDLLVDPLAYSSHGPVPVVEARFQTVQPPQLEAPPLQESHEGASVSLVLAWTALSSRTVSFTATGLPAGLSIDGKTGVISGTVAAAPGPYAVTVTLDDGFDTASVTFTWQVKPGVIEIVIEETIQVTDTVGLLPSVRLVIDETVSVTDEVGVQPARMIAVEETVIVTDGVATQSFNTPAGASQTVVFSAGTPGLAHPMVLTFANVTHPGQTTAIDISAAPALPPGFAVGQPPVLVDIATTALFTGEVEVCVTYDPATFKTANQRLFHHDGTNWTDTTTVNHRDTSTVCGTTTHFSPFAVVEPAVVPVDGRIRGDGRLATDAQAHEFHLHVSEGGRARRPNDRLRYSVTTTELTTTPGKSIGKGKAAPPVVTKVTRTDRFEATLIDTIRFYDDPAFTPGRGRTGVAVDAVVFSGAGRWNGATGYTFEARAEDRGEPGRGRDVFAITIRDSQGVVVADVRDVITAGNIQSHRVGRR
jgi:uncharacterized repeat protein (TIGR01451 family)